MSGASSLGGPAHKAAGSGGRRVSGKGSRPLGAASYAEARPASPQFTSTKVCLSAQRAAPSGREPLPRARRCPPFCARGLRATRLLTQLPTSVGPCSDRRQSTSSRSDPPPSLIYRPIESHSSLASSSCSKRFQRTGYSLGAALRKQRLRDRTGFLAHHPGPAVFLRLSKPELSPHFEV